MSWLIHNELLILILVEFATPLNYYLFSDVCVCVGRGGWLEGIVFKGIAL